MATGRLGALVLPSATWTAVYTVPSGMIATAVINCAGLTANAANVRLAFETSSTVDPAKASHFEQAASVGAHAVFTRKAIIMSSGQILMARADTASAVACVVWGLEESAS